MDEFEVSYGMVRDEFPMARDGSVSQVKAVQFWIGKHGPFWERFPHAEFSTALLAERIERMRQTLRALPR